MSAPGGRASVALSSRLAAGLSGERALWIVLALVVFLVAVLPLLYTVNAAFFRETQVGLSSERSLVAVREVFAGSAYHRYFLNAMLLAAIVTVLSLVVGVLLAVLMARTDLPLKPWLDILVILPLFVSPFTGLIAWITLGSQKTGLLNVALIAAMKSVGIGIGPVVDIWNFAGVVWIMFLFFCPYVYLFTVGGLRTMDGSLEEAARTTGATAWQTLARVTLPMALPAIFASGLLVFILCAEMYTIPGIIGSTAGFTTLPWQIYKDTTEFPVHRAHAAAAGMMLLLITVLGIWLQRGITRRAERFVTVTGKGFRGKPLALGALRSPAIGLFVLYILCADVLPFGALLLSSVMKYSAPVISRELFTLEHYAGILSLDIRAALWNTLWLAVSSGVICVAVGFTISYVEVRRGGIGPKLLAFLGVLPVAVPGLVYGIGLLWVYLRSPLYGTIWVLLMAYVAKFLPYGIMVSRSGILQIHPDLEQCARVSGASALRATWAIVMPLVKPTLIAITFFVILLSIKELSASILLASENSQTLSVLTWHYTDGGQYQFASAIGVVQTLVIIGLVVLTRAVFRVKLERTIAKA